jgi:hypothetical protein
MCPGACVRVGCVCVTVCENQGIFAMQRRDASIRTLHGSQVQHLLSPQQSHTLDI